MTKNTYGAALACGVVFAVAALAPASSYAITDSTLYPSLVAPFSLNVIVDAGDVANCLASDPSATNFDMHVTDPFGSVIYDDSEALAPFDFTFDVPIGTDVQGVTVSCQDSGSNVMTLMQYQGPLVIAPIFATPQFFLTAGGISATTTEPASEIFASSTLKASGTAQYQIVDNPVSDVFDGVVLFLLSFAGMAWLMRKH